MNKLIVDTVKCVRAIAEANPNFVYNNENGCKYVVGDKGDCLIGRGLIAAGVRSSQLELFQIGETSTNAYYAVKEMVGKDSISPDDETLMEWLNAVQVEQDAKRSWIVSVEIADGELPEVKNLIDSVLNV